MIVVIVTWWYTYGIHHGLKGFGLGRTLASVMLYNGERQCSFLPKEVQTNLPFCAGSLYFVYVNR